MSSTGGHNGDLGTKAGDSLPHLLSLQGLPRTRSFQILPSPQENLTKLEMEEGDGKVEGYELPVLNINFPNWPSL